MLVTSKEGAELLERARKLFQDLRALEQIAPSDARMIADQIVISIRGTFASAGNMLPDNLKSIP